MATKQITHATDEQWAEIERIRLRWINDEQVAQHPYEDVKKTVSDMFQLMGVDCPLVFVVDSPLVAGVLSHLLRSSLDSSLHCLRSSLDSSLHCLHSSLVSSLVSSLGSSLVSSLVSSLDSSLHSSHSSLRSSLVSSLDSSLHCLRSSLVSSLVSSLDSYCGLVWNAWAGWYEGGSALGVSYDAEKYSLFQRFSRQCPVWMWDTKAVYILSRPKTIHWQDGVLHNESGPSVFYSDLFSLWNINGVSVDEQIVMRPETQTIEQIQGEQNEEVKRVRIERFGWQRYLQETNATVIDSPRRNAIENTTESLVACGEHRVLVCACPSTAKVFSLEVPPEIETCEQAQTWLHGGAEIDNLIGKTRIIGRS